MVEHGREAGLLIVPAQLDGGTAGVFLVKTDTAGVTRERVDVRLGALRRPGRRTVFAVQMRCLVAPTLMAPPLSRSCVGRPWGCA